MAPTIRPTMHSQMMNMTMPVRFPGYAFYAWDHRTSRNQEFAANPWLARVPAGSGTGA